jgi:hypothetical protein
LASSLLARTSRSQWPGRCPGAVPEGRVVMAGSVGLYCSTIVET